MPKKETRKSGKKKPIASALLKWFKKTKAAPAAAQAKPAKKSAAPRARRKLTAPAAKLTRAAPPAAAKSATPLVVSTAPAASMPPPRPAAIEPPAPGGIPAYVDRGMPIPETYGIDRLVALVRDPQWTFCYWELSGSTLPEFQREHGQAFIDACTWALRIHRIGENLTLEVEIDPSVGNWYVNVGQPGKYQFELGLLAPDGRWFSLLVSQVVEMPAQGPSPVYDEEWRLRPQDEEALSAILESILGQLAGSRGGSGFLGASRLVSSFGVVSSMIFSGSSSRSVPGSFQGASGKVSSSSSGSGGFGWIISPNGAHEPVLVRPVVNGGPNWNRQSNLPVVSTNRTRKNGSLAGLPRVLQNVPLLEPTWPPKSVRPAGRMPVKNKQIKVRAH